MNEKIDTFLAIMRPLGLCITLVTTPPLPAPKSPKLSKSSAFNSPTFCFCDKNVSNRFLCCSSNSSPSKVLCNASILVSNCLLKLKLNFKK